MSPEFCAHCLILLYRSLDFPFCKGDESAATEVRCGRVLRNDAGPEGTVRSLDKLVHLTDI